MKINYQEKDRKKKQEIKNQKDRMRGKNQGNKNMIIDKYIFMMVMMIFNVRYVFGKQLM